MAEIEYKGIKVGGSKLLLVIPLIGTIIGGLWGGFELYNRYLMMEQKIDAYVAPDLSEFDKNLAILKEDYILMKDEIGMFKESLGDTKSDVHDIKIELKDDVGDLHDSMDKQDERNRANVDTVRGVIKTFELRMDSKLDRLDKKIDELEEQLDLKIQKALDNPLNNPVKSN